MKFAKFVGEPVDDRTLKMLQHTDLHAICKHKHIEATSDKEAIEKIKGSLWNELPKEVLAEICIVLGAKMNSWDTREDILQRICHIKTHNCDGQDCRHGSESGSSEGASPALEGEEANVLDEECDESSVGDAEYDEFYNEAVIDCLTAEETQNGLNVAWDEKLREEVIFPFVARHSGHEISVTGFVKGENPPVHVEAVSKSDGKTMRPRLADVQFVKPFPKGYKWIRCYL